MKIAAIIVCYNPEIERLQSLITMLGVSSVSSFIIDNSSQSNKELIHGFTHYLPLRKNVGIAKAQNIGVGIAMQGDFDVVVFFDQDSSIEEGFIRSLVSPLKDGVSCITAPVFRSVNYGFLYSIVRSNRFGIRKKIKPMAGNNFTTNIAISSGMAVLSPVFNRVGLMREDYFIDYVDTEWCLRASSKGYDIYINVDAQMLHEIGDITIRFFSYRIPVHSPYRRYYRIRNSFHLLRSKHIPLLFGLREVLFSLFHQLVLIVVLDRKLEYLDSLYCGLRDGIFNRVGLWKNNR